MKKNVLQVLTQISICLTLSIGLFLLSRQQARAGFGSFIKVRLKRVEAYQANGCYAPECLESEENITLDFNAEIEVAQLAPEFRYLRVRVLVDGSRACAGYVDWDTGDFSCDLGSYSAGSRRLEIIRVSAAGVRYSKLYDNNFSVCDDIDPTKCTGPHNMNDSIFQLCNQISGVGNDAARSLERCQKCFGNDGIWTAVGCIPTDTQGILQTTVKLGLFSGGGFALIMILFGAFNLSISQGDPKKISEAKDIITAAIIGLIFIIFSISILQFIGVEMLRIPGFGT